MNNLIIMTEDDKSRWYSVLEDYYRSLGHSEDKIKTEIFRIFSEAQAGWNRSPNDLDTRIKIKSGFQWKSHDNLIPKRRTIEETKTENEEDNVVGLSLKDSMSSEEKEWWDKRMAEYNADFEFNESSDKPLLEQLLVEELLQRRLFKLQLKHNNRDYSKRINDNLKRIAELQTKLGITREQRAGIMNKVDGNVAQISVSLNEKLEQMPEKMKIDLEEEMYYTTRKAQRPPINVLPHIDKIEAMLNVDGKISANLDSTKISEINEEVIKELIEKKLPPKIELSDGIDINIGN